MASLKEVDSAVSLSGGVSLKVAEPLGEGAAAHEAVDKTNGEDRGEGKAEDSQRTDASSTVNESEEMGVSEDHDGRGESSKDEEAASGHDTVSGESKAETKDEGASGVAGEADEVSQDEQDTQRDHKRDSGSSSSSDADSQPSIPPFGEAIFAAAESLYDAYMELGFHLAETSDEKTRKVPEAAMERLMKVARKMKVVEKAGEALQRESQDAQGQPARALGQPPAVMRRSKSLDQQRDPQERRLPSSSQDLNPVKEPHQDPQSTSTSLLPQTSPVAERATESRKVPAAATVACEGSHSRVAHSSFHTERKVAAKVELSGSYPVKKWDARNNLKDPGPKLYCVSSGDRGPAGQRSGAAPPKDLYDQASMLFNFAKYRSMLNASEEGKRVAFMMGLAHTPDQPRATMLRCVTADGFGGKLEASEEGRRWSTQELREHRL